MQEDIIRLWEKLAEIEHTIDEAEEEALRGEFAFGEAKARLAQLQKMRADLHDAMIAITGNVNHSNLIIGHRNRAIRTGTYIERLDNLHVYYVCLMNQPSFLEAKKKLLPKEGTGEEDSPHEIGLPANNVQKAKEETVTQRVGWVVLHGGSGFVCHHSLSPQLVDQLLKCSQAGREIRQVAFSPDGGWLLFSGDHGFSHRRIPRRLLTAVRKGCATGQLIKQVAFAPNGGWVMLFGGNGFACRGLSQNMLRELQDLSTAGQVINQVAFAPNGGWLILYGKNGFVCHNILLELVAELRQHSYAGHLIKQVAFMPNRGWVILYGGNGLTYHALPPMMLTTLQKYSAAGKWIKQIIFTFS